MNEHEPRRFTVIQLPRQRREAVTTGRVLAEQRAA